MGKLIFELGKIEVEMCDMQKKKENLLLLPLTNYVHVYMYSVHQHAGFDLDSFSSNINS